MRMHMRIRKHSQELEPKRVIQKHPKLLVKFARARIESESQVSYRDEKQGAGMWRSTRLKLRFNWGLFLRDGKEETFV